MKDKSILTTGDVAKICRVAPNTVVKWHNAGHLRGWRIPGSRDRRFARDVVLRFLHDHGIELRAVDRLQTCGLVVSPDSMLAPWLAEHFIAWRWASAATVFHAGMRVAECIPDLVVLDLTLDRGMSPGVSTYIRDHNPDAVFIALCPEDVPAHAAPAACSAAIQRPFALDALAALIAHLRTDQ